MMNVPTTEPATWPGPAATADAARQPQAAATQVNLADPLELQLWALRFDATTGHVRRAVGVVGTRVGAVADWIDGHRADDAELLALRA